ncbi:MAG: SLC13 family permease [Balneolaceae bacterium]|nr:SLC13 family permease [Balneolaceae bacterium]
MANNRYLWWTGLISGPLSALLLIGPVELGGAGPQVMAMAGIATWMSIWWIMEIIPLGATALLPLILFPLLGIMDGNSTAGAYINYVIFLFLGGFLIALAMERWELHRRIALRTLLMFGSELHRLVFSFMLASAFLSMWISNTATAVMMLPIGLAVLKNFDRRMDDEVAKRFSVVLLLGIAYGCSVGGVATLVGTPPNLAFVRIYEINMPEALPVTFGQWMLLGLPLTVIMLGITWGVLTKLKIPDLAGYRVDRSVIREEYRSLGPMSREEKVVLAVFAATALLWVFRADLRLGVLTIPGWSNLLPYPGMIDDGTVAIAMALLLFVIPAKNGNHDFLLEAHIFREVPWGIILLFGGGFALAEGFLESGLSEYIGQQFKALSGVPVLGLTGMICASVTFLTELTSNTATAQTILPIVASVANAIGVHPLLLMVPATLSASFAFMMPVATPPNAILFGSDRIPIMEMVKTGLILNLIGIVVVTFVSYFLISFIFGIS